MTAALRTDLDDLAARAAERLAAFDGAENALLETVRRATGPAVAAAPETPAPDVEDTP
jgi:hypothetical protein